MKSIFNKNIVAVCLVVLILISINFVFGTNYVSAQAGVQGNPPTGGSGVQGNPPTQTPTPPNPNTPTFTLSNPLSTKFSSIGGIVESFVEIFSYVAVLFAVFMLVYVGLKFVMARGEPAEMAKLKEWLLWIVVGVAIVIGARVIVSVVINTLEKTNAVSPAVINITKSALNASTQP